MIPSTKSNSHNFDCQGQGNMIMHMQDRSKPSETMGSTIVFEHLIVSKKGRALGPEESLES